MPVRRIATGRLLMPVWHAAAERLNVPILCVAVDWPYVLMRHSGMERQSVRGQRVAVRRLYVLIRCVRKGGLSVLGRDSSLSSP